MDSRATHPTSGLTAVMSDMTLARRSCFAYVNYRLAPSWRAVPNCAVSRVINPRLSVTSIGCYMPSVGSEDSHTDRATLRGVFERMKTLKASVAFVLAIGLLLPAAAFAQADARFTGVVLDPSGAVVPGATVV